MAGTTLSRHGFIGQPESTLRDLVIQHNKLVDDIENLRLQLNYMMPGVLLSDPAGKTGTTAATAWRTEAFTFLFRGQGPISAAAQEKAFTATTHDVAASKEAWFVLTVQSNGTSFTITKATDQTIGTKVLPAAPDNEVVVGYVGIVTNATGIWDASTADLSATEANVDSVTFVDPPTMAAAGLTAAKIGDAGGAAVTA